MDAFSFLKSKHFLKVKGGGKAIEMIAFKMELGLKSCTN